MHFFAGLEKLSAAKQYEKTAFLHGIRRSRAATGTQDL